jgi:hypothetical protein
VVAVVDEVVAVHRKPQRGSYREINRFRRGQRLTIGEFPRLSFRVNDILG